MKPVDATTDSMHAGGTGFICDDPSELDGSKRRASTPFRPPLTDLRFDSTTVQIEPEGETVSAPGAPHDWRLAASNPRLAEPVNSAGASHRQMTRADGTSFSIARPGTF